MPFIGAYSRSPKQHSRYSDGSTASKIRHGSSKIKQYFSGLAHPRGLMTPPESPVSPTSCRSSNTIISPASANQIPDLRGKIQSCLATPPFSPAEDKCSFSPGFPKVIQPAVSRDNPFEQDQEVDKPAPFPSSCPYGHQPAAEALRLMALPCASGLVPPPRPPNPLAAVMDGCPDEPPQQHEQVSPQEVCPPATSSRRPKPPHQSSMPPLNRARAGRPALYGPRPNLPPLVTNLGANTKWFEEQQQQKNQQQQTWSPELDAKPGAGKPATLSSFVNSLSPAQGDVSTAPTSLASDISFAKDAAPGVTLTAPAAEKTCANQQPTPGVPAGVHPLPPIEESPSVPPADAKLSQHESTNLSVAIVERVAATKVYFETLYNGKDFSDVTPRSLRRRQMEKVLYDATDLTPSNKSEQRRSFFCQETAYLRKLRTLKSRRTSEPSVSMDMAGFEAVRVLGKGSFGVVRLVREKTHGGSGSIGDRGEKPVYAMKVIRKSDMLQNSQEGHLRAERDFLVSCAERSNWVVPLLASFQDVDHLYLVMEYEVGGDFLGLLLRETTLNEPATRFYVAEMILCIEEAHRMRWIHRDVKPDNFLISASGHLKISDFGLAFDGHWSHNQSYYHELRYSLLEQFGLEVQGDAQDRKESATSPKHRRPVKSHGARDVFSSPQRPGTTKFEPRRLAKSVVGTSQYMAPEVVRGSWYDGRCDWWSLGIIIFECLWGYTPFCREDREATKSAILEHGKLFVFPTPEQHVSAVVQDLIFRLLQEPDLRLCSSKYQNNDFHRKLGTTYLADKGARDYRGHHVYAEDAEDIKRHAFFHGFDWDKLQQTVPPWVPRVNTADSTKYFESEEQILGDSSLDSAPSAVDNPERRVNGGSVDERRAAVGGMDGHRMPKARKPKRRARDKLLRDPAVCKTVMDARKRTAFLGYTYRRPKIWALVGGGSSADQGASSDRYTERNPAARSRDTEGDTLMGGC